VRVVPSVLAILTVLAGPARAGSSVRCDDLSTADLSIDGLLDDWPRAALIKGGSPADGQVELRCSWDGTAFALSLDVKDDRLIRVRSGKAHEDRVSITVGASGGKPLSIDVLPGNAIAKAKIVKPAVVAVADSLQPKGFSIELKVPAGALPGLSPSTPSLDLGVTFHDSDQATGGDTTPIALPLTVELGDRKDLLDDFLRSVRLKKKDVTFDRLANLDPDRRGNERIVAGGTVIGILTDQYAFVSLPVQSAADVKKVDLLPLATGFSIVSAVVRQSGGGGSRDLLMLWTVWSGQLEPLAQIEIRKQLGTSTLEAGYRIAKGKKGPELIVEPKPAVGFTAETWNEEPASDAEAIVLPWDTTKAGVAYYLRGKQLDHRDLPAPKQRK
jgi:hypothetical protein